jgi:hypothetical protein
MKINPAPFHLAQSVLIGLCTVLSIAVLGTSAHTLSVFHKNQSSNPWWLPLWPQHFDIHGTEALVGSSTSTVVLLTVYLVATLVPKFNLINKPTLRGLLGLGTTIPPAIVALITVIYCHMLNDDTPELDTIQTWTCKYKDSLPLQQDLVMPSNMGNSNFEKICTESVSPLPRRVTRRSQLLTRL